MSAGTTTNLTLSVDPSTLAEGTYHSRIRISDSEGGYIEIPVTLSVSPAFLDTPQNLEITFIDDNLTISWDAVEEADYYQIFKSDNPYDSFQSLGITANTNFTTSPGC